MSLATRFYPSSPAFLHLRSLADSPDPLSMTSPLSCGRSASPNNAWLCLFTSLAPWSPGSRAASADSLSQRSQLHSHSHFSKTLASPRSRSSRAAACGTPDGGDVTRGPLDRKRPAKLTIPECARLASLQKGKLLIPPEQQDFYRQETEQFAVAAKRGYKDYMEDSYSVSTHFQGNSKQAFFGVFDGHGGKQAAQFVAANLSQHVSAAVLNQKAGMTCLEDAMRTAYSTTDTEFLNQHTGSGACAVSVLIKEGEMVVSNAGDCKAVLCSAGQAEDLSTLHRASNEVERQRVEELGGFVDCYNGTWRLQGSLAVTRGFGDANLKRWVSAEPAIKRRNITSDCEFLILASDGLWDQLNEQEAVDCARKVLLGSDIDEHSYFAGPVPTISRISENSCGKAKHDKLQAGPKMMNACEELIRVACNRGNRDDITVMIVPVQRFTIADQ